MNMQKRNPASIILWCSQLELCLKLRRDINLLKLNLLQNQYRLLPPCLTSPCCQLSSRNDEYTGTRQGETVYFTFQHWTNVKSSHRTQSDRRGSDRMGRNRILPWWVLGSGIHSKSENIGGVYFSGQKNWRKKCVNGDDKFLRQLYVNHENGSNIVVK